MLILEKEKAIFLPFFLGKIPYPVYDFLYNRLIFTFIYLFIYLFIF